MRLGHMAFLIFLAAMGLSLWREAVGRVFVIVFLAGLLETVIGTFAILSLFRSMACLASARDVDERIEAFAETLLILILAAVSMVFLGAFAAGLVWRASL